MTVSKTTDVSRTYGTVVLRGGRLTKWKGKAASLSPSLGQLIASVSPVALGRALMVGASKTATAAVLGGAGLIVTTSGASAACSGSGGVYTCSGTMGNDAGDLNTTTTTNLLDVTVSPSTTFNVTSGDAFDLDSSAGITFTNNNSEVTIAGAVDGINAYHDGTYGGALSITTTGTTTGNGTSNPNSGIYAKNKGTDLTINAATTTGGVYGIFADNIGTGALSITTTGTTTGGVDGIQAANSGTGALSITTTGTTTGTSGSGIDAYDSNTGSVSIRTTGTTTGRTSGISAINYGGGALSITTTGTTTGETGKGIRASNLQYYDYARGTSLTINATDTTGETQGIFADNDGTGALSITTTGTTKGTSSYGIWADNSTAGTSLTISAATTTGAADGIYAVNRGTGALSITTSGAITGGTGYGIRTITAANKTTTITLNSGAVSSTAGLGIFNNGGNSTTTVNTGASVAGKIVLGDGVDSLNFAGGDFSGVTLFDGGAGTSDILKFSGSSGSVNSTLFSNWETVEINDGSTIAFSNSALTAGTLSINTGGTLNAVSGTFAMTGNLSNAGMIAMADAATGDKVTVSGNFTGGGQIKLDVDTKAKTSDQLAVAGNSSGTSQISFTNLTPGEETGATINDVVTVAGTSSATDFSGSLVGGIYTYNLTYDAGDFDLIGALNSTSSTYRVTPVILDGFNQITSLHQRTNQRQIESMSDAPMLSFLQGDFIAQQQPNIWLDIGWSRSELQTTSGTDIKNTNRDIAVGIDVDLDADANGSWVLGGSVQYATQSASVSDALGTGSAKTKGNGFGVTATWYGNAGTYVDMQGQVLRLESKISSSAGGLLVEDASSRTNAISMEVGHRIMLAQNEALIPQVQLTRGKVDGASFTDTGGTVVDLGSNETRTGRVGIAYEYVSDDTEFYGIGSILHDFGNASKMKAGNLSLLADTRETWGEIGFGGSYIMDEQTNFFGEVSYRQALNNSDMKAISVNAGIQINW